MRSKGPAEVMLQSKARAERCVGERMRFCRCPVPRQLSRKLTVHTVWTRSEKGAGNPLRDSALLNEIAAEIDALQSCCILVPTLLQRSPKSGPAKHASWTVNL
jgi:hypothetical protein